MKEVFVMMLICTGEPDFYADKINYSLEACLEDGRGTAINVYLRTKKKCEYKCVHPDYEPNQAK